MKKITVFIIMVLLSGNSLMAQIAVNTDGTPPDGSAMLDIKSTSKGLLLPRLTQAQRDAIENPSAGLQLFNTTTSKPNYFNGTAWKNYDGTDAFSLPTVTTMPVSFVPGIGGSAYCGGNVTGDGGGSTITARGVCWGGHNPVIDGFHSSDSSGTGSFTSLLINLWPFGTYYVRAYATNSAGTAYGNEVSFVAPPFVIGQSYKGGVVFYVFGGGSNGLVATSNDLQAAPWGCDGTNVVTSDSIGAGFINTVLISQNCGPNNAGFECSNGVYSFFLPSKMELQLMYNERNIIGGGFNNGIYWSSTQANINDAFGIDFTSGEPVNDTKNASHFVRAISYIYSPW
jgi:hypothetical protein